MIQDLRIKNFTVFREAKIAFAKGINVVIGSNGAGKSHILKLAYTGARWSQEMALREKTQIRPDKATLQKEMAQKLMNVFRCENVGRLSTRGQGMRRTEVTLKFHERPKAGVQFSFSTKSTVDVVLDKVPTEFYEDEAVFFPTKEMLTMFPGFTSLYRNYALQIDETYYDLCLALDKPLPRGRKLDEVRPMLAMVEDILQGQLNYELIAFI
jgi:predicted ATPase